MKSKLISAFALILFGMSAFLLPAFAYAEVLPWNVSVVVNCPDCSFSYDLASQLQKADLSPESKTNRCVYASFAAKKRRIAQLIADGFTPEESFCYVLVGLRNTLEQIKNACNRAPVDATVSFTPNGKEKFVYSEGIDGAEADVCRLFDLILSGKKVIEVPLTVLPAVTAAELKAVTVKKSSFTTSFSASGQNRAANIRLAASKIKGTVLAPGETFSFNDCVGDRTEKNGFLPSKVIANGKYADGVGGGVCQVSTTLYNAALLAGLTINEVNQHTLMSSYVEPSFDAMVSFPGADLRFTNNTDCPVYLDAAVSGKSIAFTVYGAPNRYEVRRRSDVLQRIPYSVSEIVGSPDYPELIYDDQVKVVTSGSDFVKSAGYLDYYENGKLVFTRKIRQNTYKKVDKVVARGAKRRPEAEENGANSENLSPAFAFYNAQFIAINSI